MQQRYRAVYILLSDVIARCSKMHRSQLLTNLMPMFLRRIWQRRGAEPTE